MTHSIAEDITQFNNETGCVENVVGIQIVV